MRRIQLLNALVASDTTFRLIDGEWIVRCLIGDGPLRFDVATGGGATIEHIIPRRNGGTDDLLNLGLTHAACNYEKGTHWDEPTRRRGRPKEND